MTTIGPDNFGTANFLKCTDLLPVPPRKMLGHYDPALIREAIGVPEIRERLFPTIQSGVRFWPYLLVAHELRNEQSRTRIEKTLHGLRRRQRVSPGQRPIRQRAFGPRSATTFAPYRSMYRKVVSGRDANIEDLRLILTMRFDIVVIPTSSSTTPPNGERPCAAPWAVQGDSSPDCSTGSTKRRPTPASLTAPLPSY